MFGACIAPVHVRLWGCFAPAGSTHTFFVMHTWHCAIELGSVSNITECMETLHVVSALSYDPTDSSTYGKHTYV